MKPIVFCSVVLIMAMATTSARAGSDFTGYYIGNSLTGDLMDHFRGVANTFETDRGNTYHWGAHFRAGTSLTYMHRFPTDETLPLETRQTDPKLNTLSGVGLNASQFWSVANPTPWNTALPNNPWKVVTMEPAVDQGGRPGNVFDPNFTSTLGTDTTAVNAIIQATRSNPANLSTRFFIYACWPATSPIAAGVNDNPLSINSFAAATTNDDSQPSVLTRGYYRNLYARTRAANPGVDLSVIPAGEVFDALTGLMVAGGQFQTAPIGHTALTSIDQFHRDFVHTNALGKDIIAWTAYATIFKESPVGLTPQTFTRGGDKNGYTDVLTTDLDPRDIHLIQTTIWNVVSNQQSNYTNVPEPTTGVMILGGLVYLGSRRR